LNGKQTYLCKPPYIPTKNKKLKKIMMIIVVNLSSYTFYETSGTSCLSKAG